MVEKLINLRRDMSDRSEAAYLGRIGNSEVPINPGEARNLSGPLLVRYNSASREGHDYKEKLAHLASLHKANAVLPGQSEPIIEGANIHIKAISLWNLIDEAVERVRDAARKSYDKELDTVGKTETD